MQSQKDKQNNIRNSKLEKSIKPFTLSRQETGKSKTVQKSRKGLSRVHSLSNPKMLVTTQSKVQFQGFSTANSHMPLSMPIAAQTAPHPSYYTDQLKSSYIEQHIKVINVSKGRNDQVYLNTRPDPSTNLSRFNSQQTDKLKSQSMGQFQMHNLIPSNASKSPSEQSISSSRANKNSINVPNPTVQLQHSNYKQNRTIKNQEKAYLQQKLSALQCELQKIHKQNSQLSCQNYEWKDKCSQFYQINENLHKKLQYFEQEIKFKEKCLMDKDQMLKGKQRYIVQLIEITKHDKQTIQNSNTKIRQLNNQIQKLVTRITEMQNNQRQPSAITFSNQSPSRQLIGSRELQQLHRTLQIQQNQLSSMTQQYRQQLIKMNAILQEKQAYASKCNLLNLQIQAVQRKYESLCQQFQEMHEGRKQLQRQALFGRACRKEIEQYHKLQIQYNEQLRVNKEFQLRVKQLQQRRMNQIQFHQQEMKRHSQVETNKYQNIIEVYKKERDQAREELQMVRHQYQKNQVDRNKVQQQLVISLNNQYEILIMELKEQLEQKINQNQQLEFVVGKLKQDNSYLTQRIQQIKNSSVVTSLQNITAVQPERASSIGPTLSALQIQLKSLQSRNKQITSKLTQYQLQFIKLSDKIHLLNMDGEQNKKREQGYQRMIKHLNEQIECLKTQRNRSIQQKLKLVQQVQGAKLGQKTKQFQLSTSISKCQHIEQELHIANAKVTKLQSQLEILETENKNSKQQISKLNSAYTSNLKQIELMVKQKNENAKQSSKNEESLIQIQQLNKEIDKYKECVQLYKEEIAIYKQKTMIENYISKKQVDQDKDKRTGQYKKMHEILLNQLKLIPAISLTNNSISSGIWSLPENQILQRILGYLTHLSTHMQSITQKLTKMENQCADLLQTEAATRLLAQKYHDKTLQLQALLIRMEQAHKQKIAIVKVDYDVVYNKYLKYRNMVIMHNKDREKEKHIRDRSKQNIYNIK